MGFQRFLASQLRKPHGWFGSLVVSRMMNRVNRKTIDATLAALELRPGLEVLEIGFGGGLGLQLLLGQLQAGSITGLDLSREMVRAAEARFRNEIETGRFKVQQGSVTEMPFAAASFDRVFTINTIYFWPDTMKGFAEIRRVLREGGLGAVALRSKEKMQKHKVTQYDFQLFSPEDVATLMKEAGFRDLRVDHRDQEHWYDEVIVTGRR